jgi:hypothetical protein
MILSEWRVLKSANSYCLRRAALMTQREYVVRLFGSVFLSYLALLASISDLNGTWVGTFN